MIREYEQLQFFAFVLQIGSWRFHLNVYQIAVWQALIISSGVVSALLPSFKLSKIEPENLVVDS